VQLTPQYGDRPVITLDGDPSAIAVPAVRQRRRLAATLASLSAEQWAHASRCAGWSARDVIVHLESTNAFWEFSIAAGRTGEPTRMLQTFDPVASPAKLVARSEISWPEVAERFAASSATFTALLESLDETDWPKIAEAPPGHITISATAHHALWDSWVHERDVLLPLGLPLAVEPDEVAACLRYVAGVTPGFAITRGLARTGTFAVVASDPSVAFVVEIASGVQVRDRRPDDAVELTLTGDAVELLEALSVRRPLGQVVPPESAWMIGGLQEIFEVPS
jgi:uncharacterized protein (TIGR03083 family)